MAIPENPSEILVEQFPNPAVLAMYLTGLSTDCDLAREMGYYNLGIPMLVRLEVEEKNAGAFKAAEQLTDVPYAQALVQSLIDLGGSAAVDACSFVGSYFTSGLFTLEVGAPFLHQIMHRIDPQDRNTRNIIDAVLEEYKLAQVLAYGENEGMRRAKAALHAVGLFMQF